MSDEDDNVIPFPRGQFERSRNELEAELDEYPVRERRALDSCWHRKGTFVDAGARTVTCRGCGASLDPIEVLAELARSRESLVRRGRMLRNEADHLDARVETLKRDERNTKARLRNAEHPALKEARLAFAQLEKVYWQVQGVFSKLGLDEDDSKLHHELSAAWVRCRNAADALKPARAVGDDRRAS